MMPCYSARAALWPVVCPLSELGNILAPLSGIRHPVRACTPTPVALGIVRLARSILVLDKGRWSLSRLLPLTPPRNAGRGRWTRWSV